MTFLPRDMQRHAGRYYGKYAGQVTDNEDPDRRGAVKVRVPSIFGSEDEQAVWARPCLPYGHFFVPPVDARVWVEFEAGDPDYPIWVGVWYADGEVPQGADVSPPERRVIRTASGHAVEMIDKEGEEAIVITHKDGATKIELDSEGAVTLTGKDGAKVQLSGSTATVEAPTIELKGSTVKAGDGAAEPTILGQTFASMWQTFIMHTHACAVGPTGPPTPPGQPLNSALTQKTKVV